MSSKDLKQVQVIAAEEGIPYQTLISSIIHKYAPGYKERFSNTIQVAPRPLRALGG